MRTFFTLAFTFFISPIPAQTNAQATATVRLEVGDDFQQKQKSHPAGTTFIVAEGQHTGQRVINPLKGNRWIGEEGAILDGENALSSAFYGRAVSVSTEVE